MQPYLLFLWLVILLKNICKSKSIDRLENRKIEIVEALVKLNEKVNYVVLIFNRIANTKKQTQDTEEDIKNFLEAVKKYEIPRLSKTLNEDIPFLDMKIKNYLNLYFKDSEFKYLHESYKNSLKEWHEKIINEPGKYINFNKKIEEIDDLNIKKIEESIKNLIAGIVAREGLN